MSLGLSPQQVSICLVLLLASAMGIVGFVRKEWPPAESIFNLAVGAAGLFGAKDLVVFAWTAGPIMSNERAMWLTAVAMWVMFVAVKTLLMAYRWESPGRDATAGSVEGDDGDPPPSLNTATDAEPSAEAAPKPPAAG